MTFLGAMLSLLLPRSAWRVIQRRSRTGWRQDQFLQNAEVRRKVNRAVVGLAKMAWLLTLPYSENVGVRAVACYNTRPVFGPPEGTMCSVFAQQEGAETGIARSSAEPGFIWSMDSKSELCRSVCVGVCIYTSQQHSSSLQTGVHRMAPIL